MNAITAAVLSIQVGKPQQISGEKPWTSGFLKNPVSEPLWLGTTSLAGDGQADLAHHGGVHKAVCVYPAAHYPFWRETLEMPELCGGGFGENFTVDSLTESDVCIGDVWTIGAATVQVSQPRQPCWKLARRWGIKDLALQVQQTGRTGWYFRVLTEANVQQGMSLTLAERPHPEWTIGAANQIMHHDRTNLTAAARLAELESLSPSWKETLHKRIQRKPQASESARLEGN
ncbi:MOSC domain-containing protein [Allorhodopirellula solitaria]|uniref:6-N-hydroxylaminopurine resistance protein n=1 Tax=Allorhodopirellula solitaria TaxID=2527987 RepID=A0A5C5XSS8_9BACT|nr:MOSC domain-containing protein [Allorhodopirellula solitaria]TWT64762.1 6-N-hydroxylaminopurine resistance protein [Allorhodopirellula solitaria]